MPGGCGCGSCVASADAPSRLRLRRIPCRREPLVCSAWLCCVCAQASVLDGQSDDIVNIGRVLLSVRHAQQRNLFCVATRLSCNTCVVQVCCKQPVTVHNLGASMDYVSQQYPPALATRHVAKRHPRLQQRSMLQLSAPDCTRTNTSARAPHTRMRKRCKARCTHAHARECHRTRAHARARTTVHRTARSDPLYHSAGARLVRTRRGAVHALCRAIRPQVLIRTQRLSPLCLWPEGSAGQRRSKSPPLAPTKARLANNNRWAPTNVLLRCGAVPVRR